MKRRNELLTCIRNYRFHSIFFKNLILIFGLIMLPFICVLFISVYSYNQVQRSEEKAYTDEIFIMTSKDVENLFRELRDKMILLTLDIDVQMFTYAESVEADEFYSQRNIQNFISLNTVATEVIEDVYIYNPGSQAIISSAGKWHYDDFYDKETIEQWEDTEELYQIEYVTRYYNRKWKENICLYYPYQYSRENTGVIIFCIDMDKLWNQYNYGENIRLTIVKDEQVLFSNVKEWTGRKVKECEGLLQAAANEMLITGELKENGLELILHTDNKSLYSQLYGIRRFIFLFVGIMLLITLVLVFYISRKIFDPITEILKVLEEKPGIDESRLLQNKDELAYITDSIYATISRKKDVEEELLERITLLKKAQAVALQAQINPHFINNTLETVNWMAAARLGLKNEVSEMLKCLSQLMRISLESSDTFVTLEQEVEYVKKYLFIQQKRLKNQFDVVFDLPEELKCCKIIKMVLQPVVENAINYGIIPYEDKGMIRIEAVRKQERVCISVRDSGFGLPQEEVEEINRTINSVVIKESNHIGLSNVNQRLILAFGDEYGVRMESSVNDGTVVILEIPYQI